MAISALGFAQSPPSASPEFGGQCTAGLAEGQHIMTKLKALGLKPRSEGEQQGDWVLVDAGDVIVHLFRPEVRAFYGIERIWAATSVPDKPGKVVKKAAKPRAKSAPKSAPRKKAAPARKTTRRA